MEVPDDKGRIKGAEGEFDALIREVRMVQREIAADLDGWLSARLSTSKTGRLETSLGNYRNAGGFVSFFLNAMKAAAKKLLKFILGGFEKQAARNVVYFESAGERTTKTAQERALQMVMARFGYDFKKGAMIEGGYFASLFGVGDIARKIGGFVSQAVAGKMPLDIFRRLFRGLFVGKSGGGMLERHFKTRTFDLYQAADRAMHKVLADDAGLTHFLYAGTEIETTREFCRVKIRRAFSSEQIEAWRDQKWAGKIELGYDPFLDCGGYNCRHHLSAVSKPIHDYINATYRPK